jgi:hypothetical protein
MASLTNPVNKQNIVDRFADYVVATGNSGISWGTNARPFPEFTSVYLGYEPFGGDTNGKGIEISGLNIGDTTITASTIYSVLLAETGRYTRLRSLRAQLNVTGDGGNIGSRPTAGIVYDQTAKANLQSGFLQTISPSPSAGSVTSNSTISASNLETLFDTLRTTYNAYAANAQLITVNVCHASCHSSCHTSRIRR